MTLDVDRILLGGEEVEEGVEGFSDGEGNYATSNNPKPFNGHVTRSDASLLKSHHLRSLGRSGSTISGPLTHSAKIHRVLSNGGGDAGRLAIRSKSFIAGKVNKKTRYKYTRNNKLALLNE